MRRPARRAAAFAGLIAAGLLAAPAWSQEDEVKPPSAPPYQSVRNSQDFDYPVTVPGQPTVYLEDRDVQSPVQNNINLAMDALANCKKPQFDDAIKSIRFYQGGERHNFDVHMQSARAKNRPDGFDIRQAYWSLSDANTLASVINWLLAKQAWDKCKPPATPVRRLPPPQVVPPRPVPPAAHAQPERTPTYSGLHPAPVENKTPAGLPAIAIPPPRPGVIPAAPPLAQPPAPAVLSRCPNGQAYEIRAADGTLLRMPCSVSGR